MTSTITQYETVIGLEVHLQLSTDSKLFCGCTNQFGGAPNAHVCPVCLGLPGSLPVVNKKAVEYSVKVGYALNCEINSFIKFDRKNYFYPDCPKAYQISQYDYPICKTGFLDVTLEDGNIKKVRIHRAHLEEDAGKLIHDDKNNCSLVDYNRTGTALLEIVSEPDLRSAQEAYDYLQKLKLTLSYLDVSSCDMEKGSLRCDANVSISPMGETKLGTKTELKNMNSFRAVRIAIEYEVERQKKLLDSGEKVKQETLLWNEEKQMTFTMRSKEQAHDYRYFPEPDLVPIVLDKSYLDEIKKSMPELPETKYQRFMKDYQLNDYDTNVIIQDVDLANFFETCCTIIKDGKKVCNWITGAVLKELNERKVSINNLKLSAEDLTTIIQKVEDGTISNLSGKDVLHFVIEENKKPEIIIEEKGLAQISDDSALEGIITELIKENPEIVKQILEGKEKAAGFLVGQAMKKSQGKANPKKIGDMIKRRIV